MARILVIDDDATVRLSVQLALEDADHAVQSAADGQEGISFFRERPFDLVISDIFMPEKEGLETIDEIKRMLPETKIIAISGGGRMDPDDYLAIAKSVGADLTLQKPFDIDKMVEMVADLLNR